MKVGGRCVRDRRQAKLSGMGGQDQAGQEGYQANQYNDHHHGDENKPAPLMGKGDHSVHQCACQGENNNSQKIRQDSHHGGTEALRALHDRRRIETFPHAGAESPAKPLHRQRQANDHQQTEKNLKQHCQVRPIETLPDGCRHIGEKLRQIPSQFQNPLLKKDGE